MNAARPHYFSWNLKALLGAAAGFSAWMILVPFLAGWHGAGIFVAMACGLLILLSVPMLWAMRSKIGAFQGIIIHLTVAFTATLSLISYAHLVGLPLISWPPSNPVKAADCFWMLSLFPILGLFLWFQGRFTKSAPQPQA